MTQVMFAGGSQSLAHQLDDLRERWSIRKETRTAQEWMPVVLFSQDIRPKSKFELLKMLTELREIGNTLKKQLGIARSRSANRGIFSDVHWYRESQSALASIGLHQQAIQAELSRRPKEQKTIRRDLPGYFMDVARERLPQEMFGDILTEAKRRDRLSKIGTSIETPAARPHD